MKDPIGDRMKASYEDRTRYYLPRRTYTIIRIDGKSFHTYTKGCERPFDLSLMYDMDTTTIELCKLIEGVKLGYTQSDEISILLTDFEKVGTEAWYGGNIQKLVSISSSIATANFNAVRALRGIGNLAYFDSRTFTIPEPTEVYNYFLWRQKDAIRNSILSTAQANFSHRDLQGKSCKELVPMLLEKGIDWNALNDDFRLGRFFQPVPNAETITFTDKRTGEKQNQEVIRNRWTKTAIDVQRNQSWFWGILPKYDEMIRVDNDELRESDRVSQ